MRLEKKFSEFRNCRERRPTLKELLKELKDIVTAGDLVLLSPGGSSLDEFKNFEERGEVFKNFVQREF